MHKITTTQRSTGRQLDYMAENLQRKHKSHVSVQRFTTVYESGRSKTSFWLNVDGVGFGFKDTWEEAQAYYRELMKIKPKED